MMVGGIFRRFLEGRVVFAGKTVKSLLIYRSLRTDIKTCHNLPFRKEIGR